MQILEFPQNLIGYLGYLWFVKLFKHQYRHYKDAYIINVEGRWGAITFGKYIFTDRDYYGTQILIQHEYGHRLQSKRLLMLYVFIISIPSFLWATLHTLILGRLDISYYWFYTERWANKLGRINLM